MQLIECAKAAGVTPDTLRHYLRVGLVVPDGRGTNGYRAFWGRLRKRKIKHAKPVAAVVAA